MFLGQRCVGKSLTTLYGLVVVVGGIGVCGCEGVGSFTGDGVVDCERLDG